MKELKHLGDADQAKTSAIEQMAHALSAILTPSGEGGSPLADGLDEWGTRWLSDDIFKIWAVRRDERLEVIVCPSAYEGFVAEVVLSISSTECDMDFDSWALAGLVAELRRQGVEGEIGYADCMRGTLAVALSEEADS